MQLHNIANSMLDRNAVKVLLQTKLVSKCARCYSIRRNHYDVLNLKKDCTLDEIRNAFAKLSKQYHPDTSTAGSKEQNSKKFQEIMEAYRVLSKKSSRRAYDAGGSTNHPSFGSQYAYQKRERPYKEGDYESWKEYMNNMNTRAQGLHYSYQRMHRDNPYGQYSQYSQHNPYSNYNPYNNKHWNNPQYVFDKKRLWPFLICFVMANFFIMFWVYKTSKRSRLALDDSYYTRRTMIGHGHYPVYYNQKRPSTDEPVKIEPQHTLDRPEFDSVDQKIELTSTNQ